MAAPSVYELEILGEFRMRIEDLDLNELLNSDMELLRWIRARENNLDQAELMLRRWRKEVNFDELLQWDVPKICQDLMPETFLGFDEDSCPVFFSLTGKWDLKKAIQEVGPEVILLTRWKTAKTIQEAMKGKFTSEGVPVTQHSMITDLEGLTIAQATFETLRLLSKSAQVFEANFPEYTKYAVFINAPWFFPMFYKCAKPFLSEKTTAKFHIYGTKCRNEWMEFLRSKFPLNVIPRVYGGSNDIDISLLQQTSE